jgi:hypothetical protein
MWNQPYQNWVDGGETLVIASLAPSAREAQDPIKRLKTDQKSTKPASGEKIHGAERTGQVSPAPAETP